MHLILEALLAITLSMILQSAFLESSGQILQILSQQDYGRISNLDYPAPTGLELRSCSPGSCSLNGRCSCKFEIQEVTFEWNIFHAFQAQ